MRKFTSEYQPAHKRTGRRKDLLKGIIKNTDFSRNDIQRIIKDILSKDKSEIKSIIENKDSISAYPSAYIDIATTLHTSAVKGDFDTYQKILDYGLGKPGDIIWR